MPEREYEVASMDNLAEGMKQVEVEGNPVLLVREGEKVYALSAICPHAGAPLIEGIRNGHRLVCPWHKATFCIRTGAVLEPPALDPLARFDVRIDGERILLTRSAASEAKEAPGADPRCFVIVGAGAAGAVAAQTLREVGFAGRVVMFDRENRVPYDRTVLSKYFLSGEEGSEKSPLQKQSFYQQHGIERRTATIVSVDVEGRRIGLADGSFLRYDAALLATGGTPRRPSIPGAELGNVFLLRSRSDADAILAQAERSERAVILGTSFIGMEVAASLRERGLEVTVVGQEAAPFTRQLGPHIGAAFVSLHERHGVSFRLGARVVALEGGPNIREVQLEGGERLPADLVVIGFGVTPVIPSISTLTLSDDGGVVVDANLRAADGLYAAGDIACFPSRGDGELIRVEHWRVAQQQGRIAALNMAGRTARYEATPVFWTIQYLKRLDYIGHATAWDEVVLHGDIAKPEFLAYYVKDGRVVAAVGLDRDRETAALAELFSARRDWTAAELGSSPSAILASLGGQ